MPYKPVHFVQVSMAFFQQKAIVGDLDAKLLAGRFQAGFELPFDGFVEGEDV